MADPLVELRAASDRLGREEVVAGARAFQDMVDGDGRVGDRPEPHHLGLHRLHLTGVGDQPVGRHLDPVEDLLEPQGRLEADGVGDGRRHLAQVEAADGICGPHPRGPQVAVLAIQRDRLVHLLEEAVEGGSGARRVDGLEGILLAVDEGGCREQQPERGERGAP